MSAAESYVLTAAIRDAVRGRETDVLKALGIQWNGKASHIVCPYPDHPDHEPSWRWDNKRKVAFCSCIGTRPGEGKAHGIFGIIESKDGIFGIIESKEGLDREAAKMRAAEIIGRPDLIVRANGRKYQRTDSDALLNPPAHNRDDALAWIYLGHRLGTEPERAPRPATRVVGIKSLAYFDPPPQHSGKPVHVGSFPAAIFETIDRDGKRHAHRIYLAPGGAGKAELGVTPDGGRRTAKKSAKKIENDNTAGRAVIWGDQSKAGTELIFEGVETAAAAALAFETEIADGKTLIAACITAGGIEAFRPCPSAKRVIIGADRDEASDDGRPSTRRGEAAARKFAAMHHHEIAVSIALPGKPGEKLDWLDVLRRDGVEAVRNGILTADPYTPTSGSVGDGEGHKQQAPFDIGDDAEIARLATMSPLVYDRIREAEAKRLEVRVSTLDREVARARGQFEVDSEDPGAAAFLADPEPWPEPVSGADLLDRLTEIVRMHLVLPSGAAESIALWILHAHAHDCFGISPVLGVTSPTPECGKTTCLTLLGALVPRACPASNITAAALFRAVEKWRPTLLIDEADTFLRSSDELRGVLNSATSAPTPTSSARRVTSMSPSGFAPGPQRRWHS